jgi:hypothetical protein
MFMFRTAFFLNKALIRNFSMRKLLTIWIVLAAIAAAKFTP